MTFAGPRAFARHMLSRGIAAQPLLGGLNAFGGIAMEGVLYRSGEWQVELVALMPGAVVPKHRHMRVDSVDLALGGDGVVVVGNREMRQQRRGRAEANLLRIGKGAWHEGAAGENGALYLSFQQWDGNPGLISEDWHAWK